MQKKNYFPSLLKDLMFQENKGVRINLNPTCVYAIIAPPPPQRMGSTRNDKRNATSKIGWI